MGTYGNDLAKAELERMREVSGTITDDSSLVAFLYLLGRDLLPLGQVETIADQSTGLRGEVVFTNGWLAQWSQDLANRLGGRVHDAVLPDPVHTDFDERVSSGREFRPDNDDDHHNCCCTYGAAVSGEWPEFECYNCPIHGGDGFMRSLYKCRRHRRQSAS